MFVFCNKPMIWPVCSFFVPHPITSKASNDPIAGTFRADPMAYDDLGEMAENRMSV